MLFSRQKKTPDIDYVDKYQDDIEEFLCKAFKVDRSVLHKRVCPICGQRFKAMTDAQWSITLYIHIITSKNHNLSREEAEKFLPPEEP